MVFRHYAVMPEMIMEFQLKSSVLDLKRDGINLVSSIYRANKSKNKVAYLEQFLDDFELLKLEIRLCTDMKILSIKKQVEISVLMESIGKT